MGHLDAMDTNKLTKTRSYNMPKETKIINVPVYRDKEGNPTCASHFDTGKACQFLRLAKFGTTPICIAHTIEVNLRDKNGGIKGYLQPSDTCPLWTSSNAEFPLIERQDWTKEEHLEMHGEDDEKFLSAIQTILSDGQEKTEQ